MFDTMVDNTTLLNDSNYTRSSASLGGKLATTPPVEYAPPPAHCVKYDFSHYVVILGLLCILGLVGNTLSQVVFWKKVRTNSTSFLLFILAIFDDIIVLGHFIGKGVPIICALFKVGESYLRVFDPPYQAFAWYVIHIAQMSSTWTIVLVSFCRYIAVCKPHDTAKYTSINKIRMASLVMFLLNIAIYSPRFMLYTIKYDGHKFTRVKNIEYAKTTLFNVFNLHIYYITMFLIPFVILAILTYFQIKALKLTNKKRKALTRSKREEHDVTVTLIAVVIMFIICQIWEPIRRLSDILPGAYTDCSTLKYHGYSFKTFFTALNSSINIVIYCLFGKQFRRDLIKLVIDKNIVFPETTIVSKMEPQTTQYEGHI